jgi:hypothetical protein
MVIGRKKSEIGAGLLVGVVVGQALGYGLVFDLNFFFRYPIFSPIFLTRVAISVSSVDSSWSCRTLLPIVSSVLPACPN